MNNLFRQPLTMMTALATALVLALTACASPGPPNPIAPGGPPGANLEANLAAVLTVDPGCLPTYPRAVPYDVSIAGAYEGVHACENRMGVMIVRNLTKQVWVFEAHISVVALEPTVSESFFTETRKPTALVLPNQAVIPSSRKAATWAPDIPLTAAWIGHDVVAKRASAASKTGLFAVLYRPGSKVPKALVACADAAAESVRLETAGQPTDPRNARDLMAGALTHTSGSAGCAVAVAIMDKDLRPTAKPSKVIPWAKNVEKVATRQSTLMTFEDVLKTSWKFCTHTNIGFRGISC